MITAILVVGIKESARFNATIVVIKVSVVLFVIALGSHYINRVNWGMDWHSYAPHGLAGIGKAPPTYSLRISASMPFQRRRRKPRIRNATCRSA